MDGAPILQLFRARDVVVDPPKILHRIHRVQWRQIRFIVLRIRSYGIPAPFLVHLLALTCHAKRSIAIEVAREDFLQRDSVPLTNDLNQGTPYFAC